MVRAVLFGEGNPDTETRSESSKREENVGAHL